MIFFTNSGRATFNAPRSPSLAAAPLLARGTPIVVIYRAAVWGGRGTAARVRRVGWCSGAAGVKKAVLEETYVPRSCEDPNGRHHHHRHQIAVLNNKDMY